MSDLPLVQPCATREEWLKLRGTYIGGSDAAAILGLNPHRTIGEVWIEKVRAQEALDSGEPGDPETETRFTRWGRRWESIILDEYQDVTGFAVRRPGLTLYRHPQFPFIGGTLDGDATTNFGDKRIVEAKTTDAFVQWRNQVWGESGTDDVPDQYLIQVMHYLIVRGHEGFTMADIAALIGGNDLRIFHIAYDSELAGIMIARLQEFWQLVLDRRAPNFDYSHKSAVELQRRIWNKVEGTTITVPANYQIAPSGETIVDLIIEHDDAVAEEKAAKARVEAARAQLMHIAGNNARVEIEGTPLAVQRTLRAGYHVDAYDVEPSIQMSIVLGKNNRTEKRKELLNEYRRPKLRLAE